MSGLDSCVGAADVLRAGFAERLGLGLLHRSRREHDRERFSLEYDATGPVVTATPGRAPDSNGWYNHALLVTFTGTDPTSGVDSCVPPQTYSGPDEENASVSGSCVRPRGEHDQAGVRAQLRRHAAPSSRPLRVGLPIRTAGTTMGSRSASPARMRPRVWTAACRRSPTPAPIRRTRPCRARVSIGRGTRLSAVRAQLRRDRADGDRGERLARARPRRLVQPRALDRLRRSGCDLGDRFLHAGELLRARLAERLGLRHLPRPGGEHERELGLRLPVRRDGPGRDRDPVAQPGLERLVQPRALGRLRRHGRDLRASTPASRRSPTPAPTRRTPRSPAPASTTPGTRASARSPSATTARRRRRSALRPASRIRTAGTTRRSGSRSTARTQRRGSTPVPRRRSTRARTLRTRRSAGTAPTEPAIPVPPRRSRSPMTPRLRRSRRLQAGLPTRTAGTTTR